MSTAVDFVGAPDASLAAEEVRQRIDDLNRALEHAARMRIGVTLSADFAPYDAPSAEVPLRIVILVQAMHLSTLV